jgi:hypothetical protein
MIADHMQGIEQFESELWRIADTLRANSNLASNEYFMPILGLIFLRQATNRYHQALAAIEADKAAGKMPDRPLVEADFTRRRALMLPKGARYDELMALEKGADLGAAVTAAMEAIEQHFPPLSNQLPKDYGRFDNEVLEGMMRTFDTEALRKAEGDVFGRIYEYFIAEFSKQGAHDNGGCLESLAPSWSAQCHARAARRITRGTGAFLGASRPRCSLPVTGYQRASRNSWRSWIATSAGTTRFGSRARWAFAVPPSIVGACASPHNQSKFFSASPDLALSESRLPHRSSSKMRKSPFSGCLLSGGAYEFTWEYGTTGTKHDRDITTDHGWKIVLSRGLDVYQRFEPNDAFSFANRMQQHRQCKEFNLTYVKIS